MLTIFIFFIPVFYKLSGGGIFSIFSFSVKPLEEKKTIAFSEMLAIVLLRCKGLT